MKRTVELDTIKNLIKSSEVEVFHRVHGKVCIVSVKLPNNFVVTETSGVVDPANYREDLGYRYAMERVESKLWELEGYLLQTALLGNQESE